MGALARLWGVVVQALLSRQGWRLPGCAASDELRPLSGLVLKIELPFSLPPSLSVCSRTSFFLGNLEVRFSLLRFIGLPFFFVGRIPTSKQSRRARNGFSGPSCDLGGRTLEGAREAGRTGTEPRA